jgi:hypothetical protein
MVVSLALGEVLRTPRILSALVTTIFSSYSPIRSRIVSPGAAASIASWMGVPGPGGTMCVVAPTRRGRRRPKRAPIPTQSET